MGSKSHVNESRGVPSNGLANPKEKSKQKVDNQYIGLILGACHHKKAYLHVVTIKKLLNSPQYVQVQCFQYVHNESDSEYPL